MIFLSAIISHYLVMELVYRQLKGVNIFEKSMGRKIGVGFKLSFLVTPSAKNPLVLRLILSLNQNLKAHNIKQNSF